jgi:beta-glucanase (GH16 family)
MGRSPRHTAGRRTTRPTPPARRLLGVSAVVAFMLAGFFVALTVRGGHAPLDLVQADSSFSCDTSDGGGCWIEHRLATSPAAAAVQLRSGRSSAAAAATTATPASTIAPATVHSVAPAAQTAAAGAVAAVFATTEALSRQWIWVVFQEAGGTPLRHWHVAGKLTVYAACPAAFGMWCHPSTGSSHQPTFPTATTAAPPSDSPQVVVATQPTVTSAPGTARPSSTPPTTGAQPSPGTPSSTGAASSAAAPSSPGTPSSGFPPSAVSVLPLLPKSSTGPTATATAAAAPTQQSTAAAPSGAKLLWADDFNGPAGSAPDSSYWSPTIGDKWGAGELECYTSSPSNVELDGQGHLQLTARREPSCDGTSYSSGRVETRDKVSWRYGYFEVRAKMPTGKGTWPAIWMLGPNGINNWPRSGETDIVEIVSPEPAVVHTNINGIDQSGVHWQAGWEGPGKSYTYPGGNLDDGYHTYGLNWTADSLQYYFDGILVRTITKSQVPVWLWDQNFYMLLNVAIGYSGGDPTGGTYPQEMDVDYVHVYSSKPA